MALDLKKIIQQPAPEAEYHKIAYPKRQVVIHHTASGGTTVGDIEYLNTLSGKVHVALWIDRDGSIRQAFGSQYYAPHLGTPTSTFTKFKLTNILQLIHQESVGIELDNWGFLEKGGYTTQAGKYIKKDADKFYSYTGAVIPAESVITYEKGFRGQKYYEKYTESQIKALEDLLIFLCNKYKISKKYNPDMWDVSPNALRGVNGIWTHVSYRESGKWDCHPQPELIKMLQNLEHV